MNRPSLEGRHEPEASDRDARAMSFGYIRRLLRDHSPGLRGKPSQPVSPGATGVPALRVGQPRSERMRRRTPDDDVTVLGTVVVFVAGGVIMIPFLVFLVMWTWSLI